MSKRLLVTGGAGFIGSAVVRRLVEKSKNKIVLDKLTFAGNLEALATVAGNTRYRFEQVDIVDTAALRQVFEEYSSDVVMHLAAESHVDRSIEGPAEFIQTNIVGTLKADSATLSGSISTTDLGGSSALWHLSRRAAGHRFLSHNTA